ncbi:MAG TPA: Uma2 family endonuclease [Pyrinomonadaceae bacterium]|nr:Uma2 family endonuclease [Pyrinomonadaceae bacterium]
MIAERAQAHPVFSDTDYLRYERSAQDRHEFLDGSVYAMAGESPSHSTICFNLYGSLYGQLRGKKCQGFSPNMKVATNEADLFSYPDLIIVCGQPMFRDKASDVVTNPTIIFEVLSPSTESYDRGEKFLRYTNNIASLETYVLISQSSALVEVYSKRSGWQKEEFVGLDTTITLDIVDCVLPLNELYERIGFPA